ncbi:hypothetical protein MKX01_040043 [Papaver californicum]|nr:hypothetical protein MKX01_040043 [Papaver californicum]
MRRGRKTETIPLPERVVRHPSVNCSVTTRNLTFHYSYIRKIKPGLPLFLFNYSDRKMHRIYEAVRICIRKQCKSLLEEQYKPILIDNYYTEDHFLFELDDTQTRHLISLFESSLISYLKRASRHDKKVERQLSLDLRNRSKCQWNVLQDMNVADSGENEEEGLNSSELEDDTFFYMGTDFESGSSNATPFEEENKEEVVYHKLLQIVY